MSSITTLNADQYLGLVLYILSTSITPGPGNIMSATCGANFGLIKSLPQVCGVTVGLIVLIFLGYSVFLHALIAYPTISLVIALCGVLFMLYLSWQLSKNILLSKHKTAAINNIPRMKKNISFLHSLYMQMSNPKIWAMSITVNTTYLKYTTFTLSNVVTILGLIAIVNFPSILFWAFIGSGPRELLQKNNRMHWFNFIMGMLLFLTALHMGCESIHSYIHCNITNK